MKYSILISTGGQRQFKKLSQELQRRAQDKILLFELHPRPFGSQKLRDTNFYRIRIGDYRIIYSIDDTKRVITILDIAHRREVYR